MKATLIVFIAAFCAVTGLRWWGGAFDAELGGHPDEAAHFVTGLMMRDYVASGCPGSPMRFAQEYYTHYPKIGLGVWPPFFYLVQTAWTLALPATGASVVALICALAAVVSALLFREVAARQGTFAGVVVALLFIALPIVQEYSGMVMAEMLCTLLMFGAVVAFERFLQFYTRRYAIIFGLLASLAILTKGTGLALALVPVFVVVLTWRWRLLVSPALWLGALIVIVMAGPWTWMTRDLGHGGWVYSHPTWVFTAEAVPYYLRKVYVAFGACLSALSILGALLVVRRMKTHSGGGEGHLAFVLGVLVFQSVMPVGFEARHLIPLLPSALFLASEALGQVAAWIYGQEKAPRRVNVFGLCALLFFVTHFHLVEKRCFGFRGIAEKIASSPAAHSRPVLISSDATGEGMFVAEVAMNERRPGHFIQRASKVLALSTWSGGGYHSRFSSAEELREFLRKERFEFILVDGSMPPVKRLEHHELLETALADLPSYVLAYSVPARRNGSIRSLPLRVYRSNFTR